MAIELGFTSVMMDGSLEADGKTVASYEYNVEISRKVVEYAHERGVTVEAELGTLGGIEDGHGSGEVNLTDPDQAVDFVQQTGCDCLAVAIATSHGAYKSMNIGPDGEAQPPTLAVELIVEINKRMPDVPLVMHGSSSVPPELIAAINKYGGDMKAAYGIPMEQIQEGIRRGVRKVNVDTDGRLAITRVELHPDIVFSGEKRPTPEQIESMHHQSHRACFIANSVKTAIVVLPPATP